MKKTNAVATPKKLTLTQETVRSIRVKSEVRAGEATHGCSNNTCQNHICYKN